MLGEVRKELGEISIEGSVFYVSQTPWMFNDTIRNNIVFHDEQFSQQRYQNVVNICKLERVSNFISFYLSNLT